LIEEGRLLSEMDWREFEKLIAELLERDGWDIQLLRGTKDGGIDVISSRTDPTIGPLKAVWQAKRYGEGRKVQLAHARELSGVVHREAATKGVLVTTTSLTRGALDWIKQDEFRLSARDGDEVRRWIQRHTG
jgi:restriction system protein